MNSGQEQNKLSRNQFIKLVSGIIIIVIIVAAASFKILQSIKQNRPQTTAPQEQFSGQAESSQQLQNECQNSAQNLIKKTSTQEAFEEYKRHAENCREVYFSVEQQGSFRNEGMYPDLILDLVSTAALTDRNFALQMLQFAQGLPAWQLYMGPIICESKSVLLAYEESLNSKVNFICIKSSEINSQLEVLLKNKNFNSLAQLLPPNKVAWLGSPEADIGCPEKFSTIVKAAQKATEGSFQLQPRATNNSEINNMSFVYKNQKDDDGLVLEFSLAKECVQFKAALIPGLQANE